MAQRVGRNSWQTNVQTPTGRVRRRFGTEAEAVAFETSSSTRATIQNVFERGCSLHWKGTDNERMAISHTNFLIGYFGKDNLVTSITTAAIQDMVFELRDEIGNAAGTINRKLAALSKLLTYAKDQGVIQDLPKISYRKERKGRIRYLTPEEEETLFSHLKDKHRLFATFLLYTGCRFSEALKLTWQDVSPNQVTFIDTKNEDDRAVPLTSRAQAALQFTRGEGWIRPFARIDYDTFHKDWTEAKAKAGLKHDRQVVPHVLRHTCASRLVQRGVDLYRVKTWLGHSNIKVTERYAHLAPTSLDGAARVLED